MRLVVLGLLPGCAWLTDDEVGALLDADGDRAVSAALGGPDCDDGDPAVQERVQFADGDGDGLGAERSLAAGCDAPDPGHVDDGSDCDDSRAEVGAVSPPQWVDADTDGHGDRGGPRVEPTCVLAAGFSADDLDCDDADPGVGPTTWWPDEDGDGAGDATGRTVDACSPPDGPTNPMVADSSDCDDSDPEVRGPGAHYLDDDGDGYGDPATAAPATSCQPGLGRVVDGTDCDDADPDLHPDTTWFPDDDGDGLGDAASPGVVSCAPPAPEWVRAATDCDDADAAVADFTWEDRDGDGYGAELIGCGGVAVGGDCDDDPATGAALVPGTAWVLDRDVDGYHDDTAGVTLACAPPAASIRESASGGPDCDDDDAGLSPETWWYADGDGDGYGVDDMSAQFCAALAGWAPVADDCDDDDPRVNPASLWFADGDGDGFGLAPYGEATCAPEPTLGVNDWVLVGGDCNDESSVVTDVGYADTDGDGYGLLPGEGGHCPGGVFEVGWAGVPGDCNDGEDEYDPEVTWFRDRDGDDYGGLEVSRCAPPPDGGTYVTVGGDCDDLDATAAPGLSDPPRDGVDQDCDGTDLHAPGGSVPFLPGCPTTTTVSVASDEELGTALSGLVGCTVIELAPGAYGPAVAPVVGFTDPWMLWAPDGAVFAWDDTAPVGLTLNTSAAPVYLEGLTLRGFTEAAIAVAGPVDLTVSGVVVEDGAGIVQTAALPSAVELFGVRFSSTSSALVGAPRFVASRFTSQRSTLTDTLAIEPAIDVDASGPVSVDRTTVTGAGVLGSLVRIDATDVTVTGFAMSDSVAAGALELGATGTVTVDAIDLHDNGFAGAVAAAVLELAAPRVVATDLRVVDNLANEPTRLLAACGEGDCFDLVDSTLATIERAVFARNELTDGSVTLTLFGVGTLRQVVAHQNAGDWLHTGPGLDGMSDVLVDHCTFGGYAAAKSGRIRALTGQVELRDCVLDGDEQSALAGGSTYHPGLPPEPDLGLVTVSHGSVVAAALAGTCACAGPCTPACVVDGSVVVVPSVGLVRSHVGLPAADADYRLVTTCEGQCVDSPAFDPGGPDVGAYAPDAVDAWFDVGEPRYDDGDGDGIPDDWEHRYSTPVALGAGDADADGWTDLEEFAYGTSPVAPSTDGDCLLDPVDAEPYVYTSVCPQPVP